MNKTEYEGSIGIYTFMMVDKNTIEVWGNDLDFPDSFIYLKDGDIKSEKDFQSEISYWYMSHFS